MNDAYVGDSFNAEYILNQVQNRLPLTIGGVKYVATETEPEPPIKVEWDAYADTIAITFDRKRFSLSDEHIHHFVMAPEVAEALSRDLIITLSQRAT